MKERPILFSGEMVRAILEGRKTQTRRIIKPPTPSADTPTQRNIWPPSEKHPDKWYFRDGYYACPDQDVGHYVACPYGVTGDRLWVKETWRAWSNLNHVKPRDLPKRSKVFYDATDQRRRGDKWGRLRPSIFMRRCFSRITLEVVAVRVERLQDITDGAVAKEGVSWGVDPGKPWSTNEAYRKESPARWAFRCLWESINGKGSWDSNPFVWVVEFQKL